jgi:hypothetical protein
MNEIRTTLWKGALGMTSSFMAWAASLEDQARTLSAMLGVVVTLLTILSLAYGLYRQWKRKE